MNHNKRSRLRKIQTDRFIKAHLSPHNPDHQYVSGTSNDPLTTLPSFNSLLSLTMRSYSPPSTHHWSRSSSQYDAAYFSSTSMATVLVSPGSRSVLAKPLSSFAGLLTLADFFLGATYSWATSAPLTAPVFVTFKLSLSFPPAAPSLDTERSENANVV